MGSDTELVLMFFTKVTSVLEFIKADLKLVQEKCKPRRKRNIQCFDVSRQGWLCAGLDTGDIAIWKVNLQTGQCAIMQVIQTDFDR